MRAHNLRYVRERSTNVNVTKESGSHLVNSHSVLIVVISEANLKPYNKYSFKLDYPDVVVEVILFVPENVMKAS